MSQYYLKSDERAVKGFQTTGIYPINKNIFTDKDFLAAEHTKVQTNDENRNDQQEQGVSQGIQKHQCSSTRYCNLIMYS